jgi:hypothetical protein
MRGPAARASGASSTKKQIQTVLLPPLTDVNALNDLALTSRKHAKLRLGGRVPVTVYGVCSVIWSSMWVYSFCAKAGENIGF